MLCINTSSVVTHSDDNQIPLVLCRKLDLPSRRFSLLNANLRCLNSMVDGITHQVLQGTGDLFKDGTINLCLFALQQKLKVFALLECYRTSSTIQTWRHGRKGHQAHLHQAILEGGAQAIFASKYS